MVGIAARPVDELDIHVMNNDARLMHDARIVVFDPKGMPTRSFSGFNFDDEDPIL